MQVLLGQRELVHIELVGSYVDKCSCNENTGAKMLACKEYLGRYLEPLDLLCHDGKATSFMICQ